MTNLEKYTEVYTKTFEVTEDIAKGLKISGYYGMGFCWAYGIDC